MRFAIVVAALLLVVGCCQKYEAALADLDKSVIVVQDSLVQTMDVADKAAGEAGPLYDAKDRQARLRTCFEMRALIWTTLLEEKVEYDIGKNELFYTKDGKQVAVGEGK